MTNDKSKHESRQPGKAESGGPRAESQAAAATRASPPFPPDIRHLTPVFSWRVRAKPGEFENTRGFLMSQPGDFEKSREIGSWGLEQGRAVPRSSIKHHQSSIPQGTTAFGLHPPCSVGGLSCSLRSFGTFPDNLRGSSVRDIAEKAREFRLEPPVAMDNSHANCRLESSSRFAAIAQTKGRPRLTPGGKKHLRTKRIQSRAPTRSVPCVRANGGQFEERKPSAREGGERRAKGGEPIRGSQSGVTPFPFSAFPLRPSTHPRMRRINPTTAPQGAMRRRQTLFDAAIRRSGCRFSRYPRPDKPPVPLASTGVCAC